MQGVNKAASTPHPPIPTLRFLSCQGGHLSATERTRLSHGRLARPELLPELRELLATAPPEGLPLAQLAVELRLRLHLPRLVFVLNLKSYLNLFPEEFRVQRDNSKDRKPIDMVRLVR